MSATISVRAIGYGSSVAAVAVLLMALLAGEAIGQPAPKWQVPLQAAEVEQSYRVDSDHLLLSTLRVGGTMFGWSLNDHDLAFVDLRTGSMPWRITRADLPVSRIFGVAGVARYVVVSGSDTKTPLLRLRALDRATGKPAWDYQAPAGSIVTFQPEQQRAYIAVPGGDALQVVALGLNDGKPLWESVLPKAVMRDVAPRMALIPLDDGLLVCGARLARLEAADGHIGWETTLDPQLQVLATGQLFGGRLLLYGNGVLATVSGTGEVLWSRALPERKIMQFEATEGSIFLREKDEAGRHSVTRVDGADGKVLWQSPLMDEARSSLLLSTNRVFITTATHLLALDTESGREVARAELPGFMHTESGLPDRLALANGRLVVAREVGVGAWNPADMSFAYAQPVVGDDPLRFEYASRRYALRQAARANATDRITGYVNTVGALRDQLVMQSTGKPAELTGHIGYGGGFEAAAQAANFAISVAAAGVALRNVAVNEMLDTNRKQILASQRLHEESLQGGYYMRPFYRNGWGVVLVRLADGARAEVSVGVPNEALRINSGNFPVLLVDALSGRVLVSGIGVPPDMGKTYRKFAFGQNVHGSWPGIPPTWTIPYASLFAFELGAVTFQPYVPGAEPAAPPILGKGERNLRDAILRRDINAVGSAIKGGANINAVDEIGFNSLFYAAIVDDPAVVRVLIEAGANATHRDPSGLLAYHYTFMTRGDNRSTDAIRDANLKQGGKTN
jgi:outer membrane protein assembly factor BamB